MTLRIRLLKIKHQGFSLVELMVTIALLAALLQIAIPSFGQMIATWQRNFATRALVSHLSLARSTAVKSAHRVIMCNSLDGLTCASSPHSDWKSGWFIFQDVNASGAYDEGDSIVAITNALSGVDSIVANNNVRRFVFLPNGLMSAGMSTLEVVPREGLTQKITLSRIGRVRLSTS